MPDSMLCQEPKQPKLLDQVRQYLRLHHYSIHTERSYVDPARDLSTDPLSGVTRRHHVDPSVINKAIKVTLRRVGLTKSIGAHTFRHYAEFRIMPHDSGPAGT